MGPPPGNGNTPNRNAGATTVNNGDNRSSTNERNNGVSTQTNVSTNQSQNANQVSPNRDQPLQPMLPQIPFVQRNNNPNRGSQIDIDPNEGSQNNIDSSRNAENQERPNDNNQNDNMVNVLDEIQRRADGQREDEQRAGGNAQHVDRNNLWDQMLENERRNDERNAIDVDNVPPTNRRRVQEYEAYDRHVGTGPLFSGRYNPIRLQDLQREDALRHNLDFKYLDLQILRIIIPSNKNTAQFYHGRRSNNQTTLRFKRLFLMRVVTERMIGDHMKVAYVMEARNMNENLFQNVLQYRDNGAITVGAVLRYASPHPITTYMRNDVPMLNSNTSVLVLKTSMKFSPVVMRRSIEANNLVAFVVNETRVEVYTTTPISTSCRGKLCDKQRVPEWNTDKNKGCGCYGMHANASAMALLHAIHILNPRTEDTYDTNEFSSTNFTSNYTTGPIPPSATSTVLDKAHHEQGIRLIDCMNNCMNYINNNGGFTVVGWYKRGLIDDKSLITLSKNKVEDEQVQSGEISYHIVSIMPTNSNFKNRLSAQSVALAALKFDVNEMVGM